MTAGALLASGEADADGADESVLVKLEYDSGTGRAGCQESTPAEGRMDVVRVDNAGTGLSDGSRNLARVQAAGEQATGSGRASERCRVALEQLGVLAETTALDVPIVVLPFVNTALASREPYRRSVAALASPL